MITAGGPKSVCFIFKEKNTKGKTYLYEKQKIKACQSSTKNSFCIVAMLFMNSTVESRASDLKYVPDQSIKENWDGTIILTVNAVCDLVTCSDAVITSELTLKLDENENSGYSGKFKYMGNKVVGNIGSEVPEYQYRIK